MAPPGRRLARRVLERQGYRVLEAADGEEGLSVALREGPDLVLMDIRMPVMDGLEAAMHLQSMETPPSVIFTTADSLEPALMSSSSTGIPVAFSISISEPPRWTVILALRTEL